MTRVIVAIPLALLLMSPASLAIAQQQTPTSGDHISPGVYSGRAWDGRLIQMHVMSVDPDGNLHLVMTTTMPNGAVYGPYSFVTTLVNGFPQVDQGQFHNSFRQIRGCNDGRSSAVCLFYDHDGVVARGDRATSWSQSNLVLRHL